ncbi:Tripeptidyl peptidase II-domain-containing protein, partial [Dunaliella salina]
MEITLAQFWTSPGTSSLSGDLSFHGVTIPHVGADGLAIDGAAGVSRVLVHAPLRNERVKPEAKLTHVHIPVRPVAPSGGKASLMEPLATGRDTLPNGRIIYRMVLTYKFTPAESGKHKVTVPGLNTHIYDNALESQMTMIQEADTKRMIRIDDAYPEFFQLTAGQEVEIRLALRHDDTELLERLSDKALVIERKLESPITLPMYGDKRAAVTSTGSTVNEQLLRAGDSMPLYLGAAPDAKLPKDASAGRLLVGKLSLGQLCRGSGASPATARITYTAQVGAADDDDGCFVGCAAGSC